MILLEYEAKSILSNNGIAIPKGQIISTISDTLLPCVVKSQVPTGGRGKAGGIRVVKTTNELVNTVNAVRDLSIGGFKPKVLYAEELLDIDREFYLTIRIDRDDSDIKIIAHKNGGIDVESETDFNIISIRSENIEQIHRELSEYFNLDEKNDLHGLLKNLYNCFISNDATLIEINPLVITKDNRLIAADCKMELDDMAEFRHPEWDFEEKIKSANFVSLSETGNVATIANGAGLAMATVDAVAAHGLVPANFLDIGGGANTESVLKAFRQIVEYKSVQAIVINIFAGITRCDEVAKAIVEAKNQITELPPLFIRLAGTNFEAAAEILAKENIDLLPNLEKCLDNAKESING